MANLAPRISLSLAVFVKPQGYLFINLKDGKNLSIFQLTHYICSLITEADPDTRAKIHEIRKYAASCLLQQDILVGDLTEDFNWSTPAVFYKFYFIQTDAPGMPITRPNTVRTRFRQQTALCSQRLHRARGNIQETRRSLQEVSLQQAPKRWLVHLSYTSTNHNILLWPLGAKTFCSCDLYLPP